MGLVFLADITPQLSVEIAFAFPIENAENKDRKQNTALEENFKEDEIFSSTSELIKSPLLDILFTRFLENKIGIVKKIPTPPPQTMQRDNS